MHLGVPRSRSGSAPARLRGVKHIGIRTAPRSRRTAPLAPGLTGALAAALLGVTLTGCSALSPATIATPYAAADGVEGSLTDAADGSRIDLRNMLIVAGDKGGAGNLVGTLANSGSKPVQVKIGLTPASADAQPVTVNVTVPANGAVQLGDPAGSAGAVVLVDVPPAGRMAGLTVSTEGGGVEDLTVPVMLAQGYYSTLTPAPVTTPSATSS